MNNKSHHFSETILLPEANESEYRQDQLMSWHEMCHLQHCTWMGANVCGEWTCPSVAREEPGWYNGSLPASFHSVPRHNFSCCLSVCFNPYSQPNEFSKGHFLSLIAWDRGLSSFCKDKQNTFKLLMTLQHIKAR